MAWRACALAARLAPPPLGLVGPPRSARLMSRVLAGLVLLSVGAIVDSVLHDELLRCIIIDMQQLLQMLQRTCTANNLLSCATSVTNVMHLVDMRLCDVLEIVRLARRAAVGAAAPGWCSKVRAIRQGRGASAGDRAR